MAKQIDFSQYRGVNMVGMFCSKNSKYFDGKEMRGYFLESDFSTASAMGFDFVRFPLSYKLLVRENSFELDENKLKLLDDAVQWGLKYNMHVNINLHRAPGYCVNLDEPGDRIDYTPLCKEPAMRQAFYHIWTSLARRYIEIPPEQLSFDMLNEPSGTPGRFPLSDYCQIMREAVAAVHAVDPRRICMIDGYMWGDETIEELAGIPNTMQSCRGYHPRELTHHGVFGWSEPVPTWPMKVAGHDNLIWTKELLDAHFAKWRAFSQRTHTPIFCGEFGSIGKTPAPVFYAWLDDFIDILHHLKYTMIF